MSNRRYKYGVTDLTINGRPKDLEAALNELVQNGERILGVSQLARGVVRGITEESYIEPEEPEMMHPRPWARKGGYPGD